MYSVDNERVILSICMSDAKGQRSARTRTGSFVSDVNSWLLFSITRSSPKGKGRAEAEMNGRIWKQRTREGEEVFICFHHLLSHSDHCLCSLKVLIQDFRFCLEGDETHCEEENKANGVS